MNCSLHAQDGAGALTLAVRNKYTEIAKLIQKAVPVCAFSRYVETHSATIPHILLLKIAPQ